MEKSHNCESCGMSIDDGTYCQYCANESGELRSFEELFARMVQWVKKEEGAISLEEAEDKTRVYMRTMPAWKNHPELQV